MLEALMKKKNDDGRFRYLYWIIIGIFSLLIFRLVYLQLFAGNYYHSLAEGNRLRSIPIAAMRGVMYDRNGEILVGSRPSLMVTYVPAHGGMTDGEIRALASLLAVPESQIRDKVEKVKNSYVPTVLAADLTQDIVPRSKSGGTSFPAYPSTSSPFGIIRTTV